MCVCVFIQISKKMGGVVKGLDKVVQSMDLEKVSRVRGESDKKNKKTAVYSC